MNKLYFALFAILLASAPALGAESGAPGEKAPLTVLTANIGNADLFNCGEKYIFKLCLIKIEDKIAANIKKINPDIVALQETYNDDMCKDNPDKNKQRICAQYGKKEPKYQVRRLLGDDYTIACDNRSHFECLGIKKSVGTIDGCGKGELCFGSCAVAAPAPEVCDQHAAIFAVDAVIGGRKVRIVNAHPAASNTACRTEQLQGLFCGYKGAEPVAAPKLDVLIMGDLNLNPFSDGFTDDSIDLWRNYVGDGKAFYYLSGPAEHDPPYPTNAGRTIDHVASNFATGKCTTLGREKDFPRLDGTFGDANPEGTNHSPILCKLSF